MALPAWISTLPTGIVKTDLTTDAADGVLTYAEALQLLDDVESQGAVTQTEFSSLQTLAANLNNGLAASDYVYSIVNQLVGGSPQNAKWTGGGLVSAATALGNLKIGTTATQTGDLIGQWFLGTNLPDPSPLSGSGYNVSGYANITAPLYGSTGKAMMNDVCQGGDGDCEVMTGLLLMVENHPQQLASMIVANPNGTYGVRFYLGGSEVWETVNRSLPVYNGQLVYAHNTNQQNTAIWAALIEKAYAQLSASGLIGHPAGVDSFSNINANSANFVLPTLTDASAVSYFSSSSAAWNADKIIYIDAIASGDDVMVETGNVADTKDASGNIQFVGDHAFAVVGYDAATGDFILRNPWGNSFTGQNWDTQFEASLAQIAAVKGDFAIDNTGTGGSAMTVFSETAQVLPTVTNSLTRLFKVIDANGAAPVRYEIQVVGGGALNLNGAVNLATAAQTALGQIVIAAKDLAKLTLTVAAGAGVQTVLVSVFDGLKWSATATIQTTVSGVAGVLNPVVGYNQLAGSTTALANMFQVGGTLASGNTWYAFLVSNGQGAINLNGATNYWGTQPTGEKAFEVSASQLSMLTYTAPGAGGQFTIQAQVYNGSGWSPWQTIQIGSDVSAAAALRDYANGQLAAGANVADTGVNVFANLNALQAAMNAGELKSLNLTSAGVQHESLSLAQYKGDLGVLSMLGGEVSLTAISPRHSFLNAGLSDFLISNAALSVDIGQVGANGQAALTTVGVLPAGSQVVGAGDFLAKGFAQFLTATSAGVVDAGVVTAGHVAFQQIATLAAGWSLSADGAFLGNGHDQFLLTNAAGAVEVGNVVSGQAALTSIGSLASGLKVMGAGDFLGEGHDQFLVESTAGVVDVADIVSSAIHLTQVGTLASGWQLEGAGAFLGTAGHGLSPKIDVLAETTAGLLYVGELGAGNQLAFTQIGSLASGWHFVGTGDYLNEGHDQFLVENAAGVVDIGDYFGGQLHLAQIGTIASGWLFHG